MIRWTYLIPRLVILALVVLALWVGKDPLIRSVVIKTLQNSTGAKVEIGQIRSSLSSQKIFLKGLAIADPHDPMANLIQADMAYVEFDLDQLLRRRMVIDYSHVSQIMFGSPRTTSGVLNQPEQPAAQNQSTGTPQQHVPIELLGRDWIDRLQPATPPPSSPDQFELLQVAQLQRPFWNQALPAIKDDIRLLQQMRTALKTDAQSDLRTPLRPRLENAEDDLAVLNTKLLSIKKQIAGLYETVQLNRTQLNRAYDQDLTRIRQTSGAAAFEGEQMSKLLLTQLQENQIEEIVGWFIWFRSAIPDPEVDFQPKNQRGVNLAIPGIKSQPGFLLKTVDLEGEGRFANQHFDFVGTASNLTSQPSLHDQPSEFELRAQGKQHVIVTCSLDRRGVQAIDKLKIVCPDLELEGQLLGEKNSVLVTMGPASRVQAEIEIQLVGDVLSGEFVFHYSNVSLHVDRIHEMAGGDNTALELNQGLASVNQFKTHVKLSGTINDYRYEFESDLGRQFAKAANSLLKENSHLQSNRRQSQLGQLKSDQIKFLDHQVVGQIQVLETILSDERAEIASLRTIIPNSTGRIKNYK